MHLGRREEGQKFIYVPKFIALILGNPLKENKLNLVCLFGNISNIINVTLFIVIYYSVNAVIAAKVYGISLVITLFISSIIIEILEKE